MDVKSESFSTGWRVALARRNALKAKREREVAAEEKLAAQSICNCKLCTVHHARMEERTAELLPPETPPQETDEGLPREYADLLVRVANLEDRAIREWKVTTLSDLVVSSKGEYDVLSRLRERLREKEAEVVEELLPSQKAK